MKSSPGMKSPYGRWSYRRPQEALVPTPRDEDMGLAALQEEGAYTVPDIQWNMSQTQGEDQGALAAVASSNMATYMPGIQAPRGPGPRPRGRHGYAGEDGLYRMGPAIMSPQHVQTAASPDRSRDRANPRGSINLLAAAKDDGSGRGSSGTGFWLALLLGGLALL